ncbi:MAG: helix-turn-helix domain-containing protein [Prevotellaceae bacterium]|jgi:transcriptional regulator with XRE-family HTH domain|nr:helix-turn-helix domain-containing protein [Prevotellaceae bacterium]
MEFKDRLSEIIEFRQYSDYRIAKDLDLSPSSIKNYKEGKTTPNKLTLEALARYLETTEEWLLTGEGEMDNAQESPTVHKEALYQLLLQHQSEEMNSLRREKDQKIEQLYEEAKKMSKVIGNLEGRLEFYEKDLGRQSGNPMAADCPRNYDV